jgi:hypothetical protein
MPRILERIGILPRQIPHLNKSASSEANHDIGEDEREILRELYREDFEVFGYDLEEG